MFEYHFERAIDFSREYEYISEEIEVEFIRPLAESFSANVFRVKSLGSLSLELNYWSSVLTGSIVQALLILKKPYDGGPLDEQTLALANSFLQFNADTRQALTPLEQEQRTIEASKHNLKSLIQNDASGTFANGHEAILSSMIVEAWSAFEAMSIDLWVALLNEHPIPLATNFCKKSESKSVTLDQIARYGFDLTHNMGNIVKNFSKAKFDDLNNIQASYGAAFGGDFVDVLPIDKTLHIAEKTRHLFAHRSGIVDDRYLAHCAEEKPFSEFLINERIPLDGIIVSKLVNACVQSGVNLLRWADRWSASHGK